MARTKQTSRKSTGGRAPRQQLVPGAARSPPGTEPSGSSSVASTTGATVNGSTQKRKRKRGTDDSETKKGTSTVENTSETNVKNKLLLGAQITLCEVHVDSFMALPALRVRGRGSVLKKLKEIHAQFVEASEVETVHADLKSS